MAPSVVLVNTRIIINKLLIACVVWRIDVDDIDFPRMRVLECSDCVEIIAINEDMVGDIGIFAKDTTGNDLLEDWEFFPQFLFDCLWLVLPH